MDHGIQKRLFIQQKKKKYVPSWQFEAIVPPLVATHDLKQQDDPLSLKLCTSAAGRLAVRQRLPC